MVLRGTQNGADVSYVHSYHLKEEKYRGEYVKHFSTSASVGTMQKNQWCIKSQLTFIRN